MVIHGLRRDVEAGGDLRVLEVEERDHVELTRGQPGRIAAGGRTRAAADAAGPALAQPPRHVASGRHGSEALEFHERSAQRVLVVTLRQCQRRLIGTAQLAPLLGRATPVAPDLSRVGLGDPRPELVIDAGLEAPG